MVYAQEGEQKETKVEFEEEEVVITATKTPVSVREAPASVSVVTSGEIENKVAPDLDMALKNEMGLFDRRGKGMTETVVNVQMRGFSGAERNLVLWDGQRVNNGYTSSANWSVLPVEDVERVEIVRGPFSSLYGTNAMGGVINIIPKVPQKLEAKAKFGYGTDDTKHYFVSAGDRLFDKVSLYFGYDSKYTNGYPTEWVTKTATRGAGTIPAESSPNEIKDKYGNDKVYVIGDKGDNWWKQETYSARGQWDITETTRLSLGYIHGWYQYGYDRYHVFLKDEDGHKIDDSGGQRVVFFDDGASRGFTVSPSNFLSGTGARTTQIIDGALEQKFWDQGRVKLRVGVTDEPENWYTLATSGATFDGGPGTVSRTPNRTWQTELQADVPIGKRNLLTAGIAYQHNRARIREWALDDWNHQSSTTGDLQTKNDGEDQVWGFYLQDKIDYPPYFTIYPGIRYDFWKGYNGKMESGSVSEDFPTQERGSVNPKLSIVFHPFFDPVDTVFRFSAGKAFRFPTLYDLYRTWISSSGSTFASNPNLKPETTKSWEIGADATFWKLVNLRATYFENYVDKLIYNKTISAVPYVVQKDNAAKAYIRGIEGEVRVRPVPFLDLYGNATYQKSIITDNPSNPPSEGAQIPYVPRILANLGVDFHYWKVQSTLNGHYASKVFTTDDNSDTHNGVPGSWDPYWVLDFKVGLDILKYANVSFSVANLLNNQYFQSYLAPERKFFGELTLRY
jgi:iron complex outermembrane receptor protein